MDEREPLTHEETQRLIVLAHAGDEAAQETLVLRNRALVKSIVRRFLGRGAEYEDLYQIGLMGLIKAIRNFDGSYGVRFSTYAVPMIAGEIKRFLRDDGAVKVSRTLKELAAKAAAAREYLLRQSAREPALSEIAEAVGATVEEVASALEALRPVGSIYEKAYGQDSDALVMDVLSTNEDENERALDRVMLKELIGSLSSRDRQLIILRYIEDKTQNETAEALGISQVQVSRLEAKILSRLRARAGVSA